MDTGSSSSQSQDHEEVKACATDKENTPSIQVQAQAKAQAQVCLIRATKEVLKTPAGMYTATTYKDTFFSSGENGAFPLQRKPLFIGSTLDDRSSTSTTSGERRDENDERNTHTNQETKYEDEERDDVQPKHQSYPFLQTRVEYTYTQPFVESESILFLASSSESWDCDVARETSLFDNECDDHSLEETETEAVMSLPYDNINAVHNFEHNSRRSLSDSVAASLCSEPTANRDNLNHVTYLESLFVSIQPNVEDKRMHTFDVLLCSSFSFQNSLFYACHPGARK